MKPAREAGAPYSSMIASSSSCRRAFMASCIRRSSAMRSALLVREKTGKARFAAAMAVRASSASARRTRPITCAVAGLWRSNSSVPCGVTKVPLI